MFPNRLMVNLFNHPYIDLKFILILSSKKFKQKIEIVCNDILDKLK